jgi:hypothetical protein
VTSVARVRRSRLSGLQQIGKGGQARIHLVPGLKIPGETGPFVLKEYRDKTYSISGLDRLIGFRQRLTPGDRAFLDVIANWPLRVVETDGGQADGVILPLITPDFFHEIKVRNTRNRIPRDGQYLAQPKARCDRAGVPLAGTGDRYRFCRDLAWAIAFLHKREVCLGDISFGNLVHSLTLHRCVYLVDCDAYRLKGTASIVPQLHTPDWFPPEGKDVQSERTDLYKLGLFILRVLAPVAYSAQNRDPSWADGLLDPRGRYLLRKALTSKPKAERTTAKEWFAHFEGILRQGALSTTPATSRMPARAAARGG